MSDSSGNLFRDAALASGLVAESDLTAAEAVLAAVRPGIAENDEQVGRRLADQLVKMGLLNDWQASQLQAGRTRFHLGPYRVVDSLGQGGMGQVFKAEHTLMGRIVAIKVLPRSKSTPEAIASFQREIRAQAQLDHENLVRALDAGHDGNVHFLVTEFVNGIDLRKLVRRGGRLSMHAAAWIITQAARGLEHAHAKRMIHRDVKPGNLLVSTDGHVKVSDLGLVGFLESAGVSDPTMKKVVGTADYLSPEQITSPADITHTSDIYSLGCTLYYALTGKVPFPGGTSRDKARAHTQLQPLDPRRLNPQLSAELVDVIADMMVKDPRARIQSARDCIDRLAPWCGVDHRAVIAEIAAAIEPGVVDTAAASLEASSSSSQVSQGTLPDPTASQDTLPALEAPPRRVGTTLVRRARGVVRGAVARVVGWFARPDVDRRDGPPG